MKERNREDLAWVAGFWDGEGCVGITNTASIKSHPVFAVSQAGDEAAAILQRILDIVQVRGSVGGPYTAKDRPTWTPQHQLRIWGFEGVQAILAMCWPWLTETKKAQAIRAIRAFHETHPPSEPRTHCKNGHEWREPNIAYSVTSNSWRCRVCRRKNPANERPNGQYRRVYLDADSTRRPPPTSHPQRVNWS